MRQPASFIGWDFENTWTACEGKDYPRLQWEGVACEPQPARALRRTHYAAACLPGNQRVDFVGQAGDESRDLEDE
jgi:hypothetical protein